MTSAGHASSESLVARRKETPCKTGNHAVGLSGRGEYKPDMITNDFPVYECRALLKHLLACSHNSIWSATAKIREAN